MLTTLSSAELVLPQGFRFAAMAAGIKASGRPDLAVAIADQAASAAALFTTNRVQAAPVIVGRENLKAGKGRLRAVIVNAGNANCATGPAGLQAARSVCSAAGKLLGAPAAEVFPSSTGIIGVPLPVEKITDNLPAALHAGEATLDGARAFARAILTTDTRPKWASARIQHRGKDVIIMGVCKGSGMIHPNLATMLVYLFTDVAASPAALRAMLKATTDISFNCISVDGDTSTNDTVLLCASGVSGVRLVDIQKRFSAALTEVCRSLGGQIVADGEGVKHVVMLRIEQAKSFAEAKQVARAIAHSPLVKTAWAGADPNWGRILAAIGYSGVKLDPAKVDIFFGPQQVCRKGVSHPFGEAQAHAYLSRPAYEVLVRLGRGRASARFVTCDLTTEYVHINAEYST